MAVFASLFGGRGVGYGAMRSELRGLMWEVSEMMGVGGGRLAAFLFSFVDYWVLLLFVWMACIMLILIVDVSMTLIISLV